MAVTAGYLHRLPDQRLRRSALGASKDAMRYGRSALAEKFRGNDVRQIRADAEKAKLAGKRALALRKQANDPNRPRPPNIVTLGGQFLNEAANVGVHAYGRYQRQVAKYIAPTLVPYWDNQLRRQSTRIQASTARRVNTQKGLLEHGINKSMGRRWVEQQRKNRAMAPPVRTAGRDDPRLQRRIVPRTSR